MLIVILIEVVVFEVRDMLKNNDMFDGYLKIKVNGGGCIGLIYGMLVEVEFGENDEIFEYYGLKVLVD